MISVSEARKILSNNLERGETGIKSLNSISGLVLAEDIHSPIDVPSFDNSAMDGYALTFDEEQGQWELSGVIQAGDTSVHRVEKGQAARIFTGAKMPEGTDTVIQQELITGDEVSGKIFYSHDKIQTGSNVRKKGTQCKKGDLILAKGTEVTPGIIGLLASVGIGEAKVYIPPFVGYIITGNEVKEIGTSLLEGEIYNSNGPMLEALLKDIGIREITAYKAKDDKKELQKIIEEALEKNDVLLVSGGISVGDYDFVKECLESAGVQELFYKVKQKPGKPLFVGKKEKKWVFALPGNPSSVLSCFVQYVSPSLRTQMGHQNTFTPDHVLTLVGDANKKSGLTFFMKGKKSPGRVNLLNGQQSFNLRAFATADCLVELPEELDFVKNGIQVNVYDL